MARIPGRRLFRFPRRSTAQVAADVEAELLFHLDMVTEELVRQGWAREAARFEAARRFGDVEGTKRYCRALDERKETRMRWTEGLKEIGQDLRYAGRQLWKSPGFTLVAVLTLALGTGATTAIFSIVQGVLLQPLPFKEPERLVRAYQVVDGQPDTFSVLNFLDWRAQSKSTAAAAAIDSTTLNLTGEGGEPERLRGVAVSASFFSVLGVQPLAGRTFAPDEDRAGAPRVTVISEDLWRRRFGADPGVVGRPVTLSGQPYTVIGILADEHRYPDKIDLWIPFELSEAETRPDNRGALYLDGIARLAPGVSIEQADAEADAIGRRLAQQYPESNTGYSFGVASLQEDIVGDVRTPLFILLGAVVFVLLIACVNVANLLLVRAAAREGEVAVRAALGASRARIVRQLLTESLTLAVVGGALGAVLASWLIRMLVVLAPDRIPRLEEVGLNAPVLLFTLGVTLLTGFLFGLVPALQASRPDLQETLKEGTRGTRGRAGSRARGALVVVETALAVILLAGAGLLIRSFDKLQRVELGFRPEGAVTFSLSLPRAKYEEDSQIRAFAASLMESMKQLPGVTAAGAVYPLPLSGTTFTISFEVEGRPKGRPGEEPAMRVALVTPDYYRTMGIPLLRGRVFTERDRKDSPRVAILTQSAARQYFPGEDPLGKKIVLGWNVDGVFQGGEVVGIVGDFKQSTIEGEPEPEIFLPYEQTSVGALAVVLRSDQDPAAVAAAVRREVRRLDPDLPLYNLQTLEELVGKSVSRPRFYMLLLGLFAAIALLLAAIGIYGVISYTVRQRTQEIGIRMALGATQRRVLGMVVRQGLLLALLGSVVGLAGALVMTRGMANLLYGVSSTDPATLAGVGLVLLLVAAFASYLPARRAAEIEPQLAIRGE